LGILTLVISFVIIILGYNQEILNYLGKWISDKWIKRFVILSRTNNFVTILIEIFFLSSIMFTLINSSYKFLSTVI
jgi:hypothetical protein